MDLVPGYTYVGPGEDDGTVVVTAGLEPITVKALSSYLVRTSGEPVLMGRTAGGTLVVLGAITTLDPPEWITPDQLKDALDAQRQELLGLMQKTTITTGTSDPSGSDWLTGTPSFRTVGGNPQIYVKTSAPAPNPDPTPNPGGPTPKPVSRSSVDAIGWRSADGDSETFPRAGDWTGRGDWRGAWFWGSAIADACAGKTVTKMELTISRKTGEGGDFGDVATKLFVHDRQTVGKPSAGDTFTGPKLKPGERKTITLPAGIRTQLASGAMKGIGTTGDNKPYYCAFGRTATLKITFS